MSAFSVAASIATMSLRHRGSTIAPPLPLRYATKVLGRLVCVKKEVKSFSHTVNQLPELDEILPALETANNNTDITSSKTVTVISKEMSEVADAIEQMKDEFLGYLRVYTAEKKQNECENVASAEWYFIATVFDRLLFWMFLIANIVVLSLFFWRHPDIAGESYYDEMY